MNELSERYVEVFEHIRDTYAEFDPVPEDVLAAARGALAWGLPTLPLGWYGASRNRGRELAAFVHTSAAAIGGIPSYGVLLSWQRSDPGGSPRHT